MRASFYWDRGRVMPPQQVASRFNVEIKPCPFCGSLEIGLFTSGAPHMTCGNCGADGPRAAGRRGSWDELERRQFVAVQAWNRRDATGE